MASPAIEPSPDETRTHPRDPAAFEPRDISFVRNTPKHWASSVMGSFCKFDEDRIFDIDLQTMATEGSVHGGGESDLAQVSSAATSSADRGIDHRIVLTLSDSLR